ncbi:hypothetical protein EK0264_03870 [Epidermidibacterium keratini]|uniref:DUF3784 domain-containing protein n=1 Tax=Epidermidibacterium keratini TaxID=1891644 RepID=A0A7L4YLT2_9ACTN|nr:hypothetical protein [Epidermidibacterium keratini]QHB99506.1 hypothetical protein EK0264_03870 [Epidermidibacterium keratini]
MAIFVLVLAALFGLAGLYAGARTFRRWDERNDPDYFRDVVHQSVVAFLKLGLILLLIAAAAIAVVGALAAHRGNTGIPGGVWFCLVVTMLIGGGFIASYIRRARP